MARLPDRYSLSGPESLRSGRQISSADTSAIGRGIQSLGASIQQAGSVAASIAAKEKQKDTALGIARANAYQDQSNIELANSFAGDPDYATFGPRADEKARKIAATAAEFIPDPEARELWRVQAETTAKAATDSILDKGVTLKRQSDVVKLDEALEIQRRIYVDPNSTEEQRNAARAKIEGTIEVSKGTGLLLPDEYASRKSVYLDGADLSRGLLLAESDPDAVTGPSNAMSLIKGFEGINLASYADTGGADGKQYSGHRIGYGSDTITRADGSVVRVTPGMVITQADADRDLARRVADFQSGIIEDIGSDRWAALPANVKAAVSSVAYNYGDIGPDGANIAEAVKTGDPETIAAAVEKLSSHNGGVNAKRRAQEAAIIRGDIGPDWMERLSPEDRFRVVRAAETRRTQVAVDARGSIEVAVQNAPVAIQNTGSYAGDIPTSADFVAAYGPIDGAQRAAEFEAALEVSATAHDFRTAPTEEILAAVEAARPKSSGTDAALETARYETLSKAAEQTIKARTDDPAAFAQQTFPSVAKAWEGATTPEGYKSALAASAAAQEQLGISEMRLLPDAVAKNVVTKFKDETLAGEDRVTAAAQAVMLTPDAKQRRAVFDQLVDAGLPASTEGAFDALARGDNGAAARLFQAAMVDPSKLPGAVVDGSGNKITTDKINQEVQTRLLGAGQIGDIYYGLSNGDAVNLERAQRDAPLISNSVALRIRSGASLEDAIAGVQKDLFGDLVAVQDQNVSVLVEKDVDQATVKRGFAGLLPRVRAALEAKASVPAEMETANGTKAVFDAVSANHLDAIMAEGYFRNAGDGYTFIDAFTGEAVSDAADEPIIFTSDEVFAAAGSAPAPIDPVEQERLLLEEQAETFGMMGGSAQ